MTSTIKVDNIQDQDGNNIINENSNTITIGASGDTVTLASGASQSGFGRTGTVDWQTGSIKTATFTAANGEGYFCNTTSGGFTVNLPAGSAGAIVSLQDYNNTFDSESLTVAPNGSEKINGGSAGGSIVLTTEGEGITLVYIDGTVGWRSIQDNVFADTGSTNLIASGGTITTSGNYRIHTFTSPGTFTVSQVSQTAADNTVSYLVTAGGGGGGARYGGGGGAGGFREYKGPADCYTASPLNGNPGGTAVTVTAQAYPITVGSGGAGSPTQASGGCSSLGTNGSNSIFSTVTSTGGGGGASEASSGPPANPGTRMGAPGGSGGGASYKFPSSTGSGGAGNTPPVSPSQGNGGGNGGPSTGYSPGGGGGAGAGGTSGADNNPGEGGNGVTSSITASPVARAGGGGGAGTQDGGPGARPGAAGGSGGGGAGGTSPNGLAAAGTDNTGGGGGGGRGNPDTSPQTTSNGGGNGGSGIVIIRYKFQ